MIILKEDGGLSRQDYGKIRTSVLTSHKGYTGHTLLISPGMVIIITLQGPPLIQSLSDERNFEKLSDAAYFDVVRGQKWLRD